MTIFAVFDTFVGEGEDLVSLHLTKDGAREAAIECSQAYPDKFGWIGDILRHGDHVISVKEMLVLP